MSSPDQKWTTDYFKAYVRVSGYVPYALGSKKMFQCFASLAASDEDNSPEQRRLMGVIADEIAASSRWERE